MIELKVGNKTINFRKWKVKDRLKLKNFIKEHPDDTQAIATETLNCLVFDCLDTKYPLNLDEITYVFANIRKHSISDEITFEYECEMCKTKNKEIIKIDDLYKVNFSDSKEININNLKITLNDNTLVYDELKLDFPKKYLITGENGSGKSVLAKLIMGFLVANEGKILYNDFNSINISEHINYVPQVPVIFEGSYMDNITIYGTYSDKNLELYESCFPPQVIKNIKSNENLENLSSGEKQIIAIIRAFCSEKEFIILDEALSVMNQITIEKFMETIFDLNKSIVIIAHNVDEYKDRFYKTYKVIRKEI